MRLHAAYAVPHYADALWKHQRRFKHATFFCPSAALMSTHPAQKHDRNQVCTKKIGTFAATNGELRGGGGGKGGVSFIWPSEHKKGATYLPTVWLASWRIRLNCFFILYFLYFNAYWGVIFRIISLVMVRAPRRRSAESTLTCFPLPSSQAADGGSIPPLHLFSFFSPLQ